jgi:hypothetical protein
MPDRFVRLRDEIDVTATFKQKKINLVKDGSTQQQATTRLFQ